MSVTTTIPKCRTSPSHFVKLPKLLTDPDTRGNGDSIRKVQKYLFSSKIDDSDGGERSSSYFDRLGVPVPFVSEPPVVPELFAGVGLQAMCVPLLLSLLTASLCDSLEAQQ